MQYTISWSFEDKKVEIKETDQGLKFWVSKHYVTLLSSSNQWSSSENFSLWGKLRLYVAKIRHCCGYLT